MALGGDYYTLHHSGRLAEGETMEQLEKVRSVQKVIDYSKRLTITVSGVGALYPQMDSPLVQGTFLSAIEKDELMEKGACADFLLHFLDQNGNEIESSVRDKTMSISLDMYKNTPNKIVVASGGIKAHAVRALLRAKLADVLVIDEALARGLLSLNASENVAF